MLNAEIQAGWNYHNATKHSHRSIRTNPHFLDWANQPLSFKIYPKLDLIPLPRELREIGVPALSTIAQVSRRDNALPDFQTLSELLYFSQASRGGALFLVERSISVPRHAPVPSMRSNFILLADLFQISRQDSITTLLANLDCAGCVPATVGACWRRRPLASLRFAQAPVIVICTGTYWRNAWKYQARTYRHFGWDNGTILANLLAISTAMKLPARLVMGFVDNKINTLLGLDTKREVAFSIASIGRMEATVPAAQPV